MSQNCVPIASVIIKIHKETFHESEINPMDFGVIRSKSQYIDNRKWFMLHNCFSFTPIILKLHTKPPHALRMCPMDFASKGQGHNALITKMVYVT